MNERLVHVAVTAYGTAHELRTPGRSPGFARTERPVRLGGPVHGFCAELREYVRARERDESSVRNPGHLGEARLTQARRHTQDRGGCNSRRSDGRRTLACGLAREREERVRGGTRRRARSAQGTTRGRTAAEGARHRRAARCAGNIVLPVGVVVARAGGVLLILEWSGARSVPY